MFLNIFVHGFGGKYTSGCAKLKQERDRVKSQSARVKTYDILQIRHSSENMLTDSAMVLCRGRRIGYVEKMKVKSYSQKLK